jgi:hypothetical protein
VIPNARAEARPLLDLDDPRLLIELDPESSEFDECDHRLCCRTWAPRVMHVATHRHQLCSQSFVLARDALPLNERGVELVLCAPLGDGDDSGAFCYDDLHAALIDACAPSTERVVLAGVQRDRVPALLVARRTPPQQQLASALARHSKAN